MGDLAFNPRRATVVVQVMSNMLFNRTCSGRAPRALRGQASSLSESTRQIRVISLRKATKHEQAIYFKNL